MDSTAIMERIVSILDSKKAKNIEVLDIRELTTMADYFVVCSGTSSTHIKALAGEVDEKLDKDEGILPLGKEGFSTAYWVLMDYDSVIVHIFCEEARDFYSVESLWADAARVDISKFVVQD